MNHPDDSWKKLVRAARQALDEDEPAPPPAPPVGRLKRTVQALVLTLTWRKWAFAAAVLAAIVAIVALLLSDDGKPERPIIEPEPPLPEELP